MCIYMLQEDKQPSIIELFELYILDFFAIQISSQEVWDRARQSEKAPHLGNIYTELIFSKFKSRLEEKHPGIKVRFTINGVDSCFYINDEKINSFLDLMDY